MTISIPSKFDNILILFSTAMGIFAVLSWKIFKITKKRLAEKENELTAYQLYFPAINNLIDQIMIQQHQFDNHIQAIEMLPVTHKDYNSLANSINAYFSYISSSFRNSTLLKLNNKLLAGFLFSKCQEAEENNRELKILIKNTNIPSVIPEYELINIIGILIDNGLSGVSENGCVILCIDSISNHCLIQSKNKGPVLTDELRLNLFKKGYTTKTEKYRNHGLGLYNLKKIIKKYNGTITVSNETEASNTYIVFEVEI